MLRRGSLHFNLLYNMYIWNGTEVSRLVRATTLANAYKLERSLAKEETVKFLLNTQDKSPITETDSKGYLVNSSKVGNHLIDQVLSKRQQKRGYSVIQDSLVTYNVTVNETKKDEVIEYLYNVR